MRQFPPSSSDYIYRVRELIVRHIAIEGRRLNVGMSKRVLNRPHADASCVQARCVSVVRTFGSKLPDGIFQDRFELSLFSRQVRRTESLDFFSPISSSSLP